MSLLSDARHLRDRSLDFPPGSDRDDRPNPRATMDRIMTALEAAERVVVAFEGDALEGPDVLETIRPLVAALKGEEAP